MRMDDPRARVDPSEIRGPIYSLRRADLESPWWLLSNFEVVAELRFIKYEEKYNFFSVRFGRNQEWAHGKLREFCDLRREDSPEFGLVCGRTMRCDASPGFIAHVNHDLSVIRLFLVYQASIRADLTAMGDWLYVWGRRFSS